MLDYFYKMSGLQVAADVVLPGVPAPSTGAPDITIRRGPVPEELRAAQIRGVNWAVQDGTFLLRIPGVGRFLIRDGSAITYDSPPARRHITPQSFWSAACSVSRSISGAAWSCMPAR
jgi:hypothetical protein